MSFLRHPNYWDRGVEWLPHALDAWNDYRKFRIGYEIPFNRHYYVFKPTASSPRSMPS